MGQQVHGIVDRVADGHGKLDSGDSTALQGYKGEDLVNKKSHDVGW